MCFFEIKLNLIKSIILLVETPLFFNDFFKVFPKLVKNVTKKWAKIEKIQLNFEWLYLRCYSTYIKNKTSFKTLKPYIFYLNNN